MVELLRLLETHGYGLILAAAFVEQMGLPLPAVPLLIAMGALTHSGSYSVSFVILMALTGSLMADFMWYYMGRRHGRRVLRLLCRISLEPDYCVRRTEDAFERHGLWALLLAKFVPGLNAAAVPLAGMVQTPLARFAVFDAAGLILWACAYTVLGFVFSHQIERMAAALASLGTSVVVMTAIGIAIYVGYKYNQRRKFLNTLTIARITPDELQAKMAAGDRVLILDMRNPLDRQFDPVRIPGAFHVLPEHVELQRRDIEPRQEIVIYCT
jgi:membrane protein DedA with SNARE-associated domain